MFHTTCSPVLQESIIQLFHVCTANEDATPPVAGVVSFEQDSKRTVLVTWDGFEEEESEIVLYSVSFSRTPGQADLYGPVELDKDSTEMRLDDSELGDIADGDLVCSTVVAQNSGGLSISAVTCKPYDLGPPVVLDLRDGPASAEQDADAQLSLTTITATWSAIADVSSITDATWSIGSNVPGDIMPLTTFDPSLAEELRYSGLSLAHGITYTVTVCLIDSLEWTACYSTDGCVFFLCCFLLRRCAERARFAVAE